MMTDENILRGVYHLLLFTHIYAFADLSIMKTKSAVESKELSDTVAAAFAALVNLGRLIKK